MICFILLEDVVLEFNTFHTNLLSMESKYSHQVMLKCLQQQMEIYVLKQLLGPFTIENTPSDIVKSLVIPIENSNKNLTTDIQALVDYLSEKKITFIGSVKKNERNS